MTCLTSRRELRLDLHAVISDPLRQCDRTTQDEVSRQKGLEEMIQQLRSRALQQASSTVLLNRFVDYTDSEYRKKESV
jgi:hypothetical protein